MNLSTYQERREAKKFIEQRMRELSLSKYDLTRNMDDKMPADLKVADKKVRAWKRKAEKSGEAIANRYGKRFNCLRELIVLGKFTEAIAVLKQLEKARAEILKKHKV